MAGKDKRRVVHVTHEDGSRSTVTVVVSGSDRLIVNVEPAVRGYGVFVDSHEVVSRW